MALRNFKNQDGSLNDDGRKLVEWLDANMQHMDTLEASQIDTYAGVLKYLWTNRKTTGMTAQRFVEDFARSHALNAWQVMEAVQGAQEQAERIEETADKTDALVQQLEALKELVEAQAEEIKALKEAQPKPPRKTKKEQPVQEAEEAEAAAADETDDEGE